MNWLTDRPILFFPFSGGGPYCAIDLIKGLASPVADVVIAIGRSGISRLKDSSRTNLILDWRTNQGVVPRLTAETGAARVDRE